MEYRRYGDGIQKLLSALLNASPFGILTTKTLESFMVLDVIKLHHEKWDFMDSVRTIRCEFRI